jgi:predicted ATPase
VESISLKSYPEEGSYLHALPAVRNLQALGRLSFDSSVVFLIGENGTGKSTLLEAIAVLLGFNPEGGSRNFSFATLETHSDLFKHMRVSRRAQFKDGFFLRAESFYNVATNIDELDVVHNYGGVSLHRQSHGESFLALVQNRFGGHGLYLLDEPEAALSPARLMTLLIEMNELVKKDSQFIICTHSPILMTYPGAQVIELTEDSIKTVPYKETDHYQMTKRFLDNPEQMLKYLFAE